MHIVSGIPSFRLKFICIYLYNDVHPCYKIANVTFRRFHRLSYTKQLFLIELNNIYPSELSQFYNSVLIKWNVLEKLLVDDPSDYVTIIEQPLWYNVRITHTPICNAITMQLLIQTGNTVIRDLIQPTVYQHDVALSVRVIENLKKHIFHECLPIQWQNVINVGVIDDDVYAISNIQVWFEHDFVVDLNSFVKKDLYTLFLLHYNSDDSYNRLVWCDLLLFDVSQARYFENCYSPMLRQK